MTLRPQTSSSYYLLPTGYHVEQNRGLLVLRRPDGSVMETFGGQQAIAEIVERRAWEDSSSVEQQQECKDGRQGSSAYERFLELPVAAVVGLLWIVGLIPIGLLWAVAFYSLWLLLGTVAGG
jgi:hypothetical protein